MCGIAGFSIADGDFRKINTRRLSWHLLNHIQTRGKHATGAAWTQASPTDGEKPEIWYNKAPKPASKFKGELMEMPEFTRTAILHTRWATQGDPSDNNNNHPIVLPGLVGVHNGHINNDHRLIADLKAQRVGEVDSEAAFHLIQSDTDPTKVLGKLSGNAALAWIKVGSPRTLHLARVKGSPLAIAETAEGSIIFASTVPLLTAALADANIEPVFVHDVEEMTYIKVNKGTLMDWTTIKPHGYIHTSYVDRLILGR